jgi:hypothetical protein
MTRTGESGPRDWLTEEPPHGHGGNGQEQDACINATAAAKTGVDIFMPESRSIDDSTEGSQSRSNAPAWLVPFPARLLGLGHALRALRIYRQQFGNPTCT